MAIILLSAGLVFTGNGLLQTMLPMRADLEHFSTAMIGLQGTAYFGGFIAGCVLGPGLIKNVGHIRAFAGVVAILAALILLCRSGSRLMHGSACACSPAPAWRSRSCPWKAG